MSKLKCICGHIIADQRDNLSYKGEIIPDQSFEDFFDQIDTALKDLILASKEGKRKEWIAKYFLDGYPRDLSDIQMMADIFSRYYFPLSKDIYQCEKCGRLWIQTDKTNQFVSFIPEDENWQKVLEKVKKEE